MASMANAPAEVEGIEIVSALKLRRNYYDLADGGCPLIVYAQPETAVRALDDFRQVLDEQPTPYDFWEMVGECDALGFNDEKNIIGIDISKIVRNYSGWLRTLIKARWKQFFVASSITTIVTVNEEGGLAFAKLVHAALQVPSIRLISLSRSDLGRVMPTSPLPADIECLFTEHDRHLFLVDDGINHGLTMRQLIAVCRGLGRIPVGAMVLSSKLNAAHHQGVQFGMATGKLVPLYSWAGRPGRNEDVAIEQLTKMLGNPSAEKIWERVLEGMILDFMARTGFSIFDVLTQFPATMRILMTVPEKRLKALLTVAAKGHRDFASFEHEAISRFPFLWKRVEHEFIEVPSIMSHSELEPSPSKSGFSQGAAIVIGVSDYLDPTMNLPDAVSNDAKDVEELLAAKEYCGYSRSRIFRFINAEATGDAVREGFDSISAVTCTTDTVVIFFSGHGWYDSASGESYLLPYDCQRGSFRVTAISGTEFKGFVDKIKAQKVLIVLDSCYSGGIKAADGVQPSIKEVFTKSLAEGRGRIVITSCRETELSYIHAHAKNSVFTGALLEGLRGAAVTSPGKAEISAFELIEYLGNTVPAKEPRQHPNVHAYNAEAPFSIALNLGGKAKGRARQEEANSKVIDALKRKIAHHEYELVICADADQKFKIEESLSQARSRLEELLR